MRCVSPRHGNITNFLSDPALRNWLVAGHSDWRSTFARQHYCSLPASGSFGSTTLPQRRTSAPSFACQNSSWSTPQPRQERRDLPAVVEPSGLWVAPSVWQPVVRCDGYAWLNFAESLQCLSGRVLIIEGDSLARQVFLRYIWWLRELPVLVEHFFHQHAIYTFNRTHDALHVVGNASLGVNLHPRNLEDEAELLRLVRAQLSSGAKNAVIVWRAVSRPRVLEEDPLLAPDGLFHSLPPHAIACVVRGFMGSFSVRWHQMHPEDQHSASRQEARQRSSVAAAAWRTEHFSLDAMNEARGEPHFFSRNRMCVCGSRGCGNGNWCKYETDALLKAAGQRTFPHVSPHPFRLLEANDAHFTCGLEPILVVTPESSSEAGLLQPAPRDGMSSAAVRKHSHREVKGWKMPMNLDCSSTLELNFAMAVLNRIGC